MRFKDYQPSLAPGYFKDDEYKNKFEEASGQMKDDVSDSLMNSMLNAYTQTAIDPVALDYIGKDYNIRKPPPFSTEQWRIKLGKAWDYWNTSGTPSRLITELKDATGFPNIIIVPQYLETAPGIFSKTLPIVDLNPTIEAANNFWSNFWVLIEQPHTFLPNKWGSPQVGKWNVSGSGRAIKWGSISGDQDLLAYMVETIKKLKTAWTMCRGIIFIDITGFAPIWGQPNYNDGTIWGWIPGSYSIHRIIENWEYPNTIPTPEL